MFDFGINAGLLEVYNSYFPNKCGKCYFPRTLTEVAQTSVVGWASVECREGTLRTCWDIILSTSVFNNWI